MLRRAFELMTASAEALARLMVLENGKALRDARGEAAYSAEFFRWYAEEAVRMEGSGRQAPAGANRILVMRQPVGVSVLVTPWNFPAAMADPQDRPGARRGLHRRAEARLGDPAHGPSGRGDPGGGRSPAGVVNVIPPTAPRGVGAMLADPRVRKLSFTGSTEWAGRSSDRGRPGDQLLDGARRQRPLRHLRRRGPRRRARGGVDREDAQRRRGVHGSQPFLRPRGGRRRVPGVRAAMGGLASGPVWMSGTTSARWSTRTPVKGRSARHRGGDDGAGC